MDEGTAIAKGGRSQWCHSLASTSGPGLSPNQGPQFIGEELGVQGVPGSLASLSHRVALLGRLDHHPQSHAGREAPLVLRFLGEAGSEGTEGPL